MLTARRVPGSLAIHAPWSAAAAAPLLKFGSCRVKETSLKIFKHYKLKPSFPIMIKDNKKKDRAGVGWGTTPHPQVLSDQLIQILSKKLIRTEMDQFRFDPIWSILIQLDLII